MITIALLAGARPNFIKAAPLWRAFNRAAEMQVRLIHTGQQRDAAMSTAILREMGLPDPDVVLSGNGQTILQESARIALALEPVLLEWKPDWVVAIGDVTSTLAGTVAAKQMGLRVAHVEAGLRSGDRQMPEELNRIAVDHLADALFASEPAAVDNLHREGLPAGRVFFSGNVLIDALADKHRQINAWSREEIFHPLLGTGLEATLDRDFALITVHRPSNVDTPEGLRRIAGLLRVAARHLPVVFPVHPRTWNNMQQFGLNQMLVEGSGVLVLPPLGYGQMVGLLQRARLVITDSGGVQEETTWLGKPCLTFRTHTERPATTQIGTNTLIADLNPETADHYIRLILAGQYKTGGIPPLWDGQAAGRIVDQLAALQ